ncbi:hypothetical protein ACUXK4_003077 [Methylorubrum extorquens]
MTPATLTRLGELLYGPRYATALAEALSADGEHRAQVSHVSTWCAGKRPIPAWVAGRAREIATQGQRDLVERLTALSELLIDPTALHPSQPARPGRLDRLRGPHPDDLPDTEPTDA